MRVALITIRIMTETGGAKKSLRSRDNTQNALSWVGPWSRGARKLEQSKDFS